MSDNDRLKRRIEKALPRLKAVMGLADWEHSVVMYDKQPESDDNETYEQQTALEMESFPKYLRFKLNVYPKFALRIKDRDYNFELYLFHELGHVLLAEYDELLDHLLSNSDEHLHTSIAERTTERIAKAIMRATGKL